MYGIGEKVVYGAFGVMQIIDIADQTVGDVMRKYYVMSEYFANSPSLTYVPLDNEMLTSQIRPLLTKEEIVEAIRAAKRDVTIEWIEDNRARSEAYKRMLSTGDRALLIAMIDTVRKTGVRRESEGKRNYIADENSMRRAEKLISSEFSLVLGIPESEVEEFIKGV